MITDSETNFLFLADSLPEKHKEFFEQFKELLTSFEVDFELLPNTKDIWAVDYMPIQIHENTFVQFNYNPDYLQQKKWRVTISNADNICKAIHISQVKSNLVVDGGNVIRAKDKVIMCDKVFKENLNVSRKNLIELLHSYLQVSKIIFIPTQLNDVFGHADGVVRFIDEHAVLINDYKKQDFEYEEKLKSILEKENLNWVGIPYNPYSNKTKLSARGVYINYLHMKGLIILPVFGMKEDEVTVEWLERIFYRENIITIDCNEIAEEGGLLNCISWNILKEEIKN